VRKVMSSSEMLQQQQGICYYSCCYDVTEVELGVGTFSAKSTTGLKIEISKYKLAAL